jgi:hypothetical protein
MIDLNKFDTRKAAEKGFILNLKHPVTGSKLDGWIELRGKDSDTYQEKILKISRELVTQKDEFSESQIRARLLAAATITWGEIAVGEKPVEYEHDKAVWLYDNFAWIAEQVNVAINDRANFMPG